MNLGSRQEMLSKIGISSWFSRFKLPNAAASPVIESEQDNNSESTPVVSINPVETETVESATSKSTPILDAHLETVKHSLETPEPVKIAAKDSEPDFPKKEINPLAVEFRLHLYFSKSFILIDALPQQSQTGELEYSKRLAVNIFKALEEELVADHDVNWPMHDNPASLRDADTAREYVRSLISFNSDKNLKSVIACGSDALRYAFNTEGKPGHQFKDELGSENKVNVIVNYSLSQLLNSGAMKAEFWSFCQSIRL